MITTKSEMKEELIRFIGDYWFTGREKAAGIIDDMMDMAPEKTVTELLSYFNEYYSLETPECWASIWQAACYMKVFAVWEDPEKELRRCLDEFEGISEEVPRSMACHADELPFEEQAALFAGIELEGQSASADFYRRVCRYYPNLEEIHIIYASVCLEQQRFREACRAVKKLEEKYPEDFELLKKRLAIYRQAGTKEEVHKAAADMLEYQKKNNTYSGWVTLNYAGNVQLEHGDMEGAYESFRHLINDWSRLSLKEEEGCMYVASSFVNIMQLPSKLLEEDISLIAVQFCMFEQAMERVGVDLNEDPYRNIISTFVVEVSKKLGNSAFRKAFVLLLETLEERPALSSRWHRESFESGHVALESYRLNEDERIPRDLRFLCLPLYSDGQGDEIMPYSEKYELYQYIMTDLSWKNFFKEQYPYFYEKLRKMIHEVEKKGSPAGIWGETKMKPVVKTEKKVGRNDPCPCGSGKKYKKCCGK